MRRDEGIDSRCQLGLSKMTCLIGRIVEPWHDSNDYRKAAHAPPLPFRSAQPDRHSRALHPDLYAQLGRRHDPHQHRSPIWVQWKISPHGETTKTQFLSDRRGYSLQASLVMAVA